jgi:hypothetical protein
VHENKRSPVFRTIFESPNEVNCYAFSRLLSKPLPWVGPGQVTDPREKPWRLGWAVDVFDKKISMDWASRRYARKAAVPLIPAFSRTFKILGLVIDIGGRGFQAHSWVPDARWMLFLWEPFVDQGRTPGMDFLRDKKREAMRMAECCLGDVPATERVLSNEDYEKLTVLFEGELLIIRAYEAVLEGYYQVHLRQQGQSRSGLETAAHALSALASEVSHGRGEKFFGALPNTLRAMGEFVREGKPPARIASS